MEKFKFLNNISHLPETPGVYAFKKAREIVYIGKAINIKGRVKNHNLDKVDKIGFIKTESEIEALILEANLIKKYKPKKNIIWKDDKNYFYICITKEDFPRVFITHQPGKVETIGPFVDGKALKQTLKFLRKAFPFRTCKILPKKPCLWYQLQRCPAPCLLKSNLGQQIPKARIKMKKQYQSNIKHLKALLQGKKEEIMAALKKEMKAHSKLQNFEKARETRNQIQSLEKIIDNARVFDLIEVEPQTVPYRRIESYDISNIQGKQATGSMVIFINGKPAKNLYRKFKIKQTEEPNDTAMLKEVLSRRIKHQEWPLPNLILIDGGKAQLNAALNVVKNIKVMSLAKKKNELFIKGKDKPILLKSLPRDFANLILQLRDEAHRFAIAYHKKLREKNLLGL